MRVLSFGELLLRLNSPSYEKLFQSNMLVSSFCGSEANVAVSLSNFGLDSIFVTKLPNNDVGKAAMHSLDYFKVDTSKIVFGQGRMGLFYLERGASQRPSKVIYDRSDSAFSISNGDEFNWEEIFDGVDWFHWSGINPALSDNVFKMIFDACCVAKKRGIVISCDLNYRNKLWTPSQAQLKMKQLMKYVDVCIANEEDAQLSLGINADSQIPADLKQDFYRIISDTIIKEYGCKYVAFSLRDSYNATINGWSAVLFDDKNAYTSKKYDIQLVDRVGGGDSFAAGLIYGLLTKMKPQEAIEFATASSCLKQTIEGDFNRVSVDDVKNLLQTSGSGRIQR